MNRRLRHVAAAFALLTVVWGVINTIVSWDDVTHDDVRLRAWIVSAAGLAVVFVAVIAFHEYRDVATSRDHATSRAEGLEEEMRDLRKGRPRWQILIDEINRVEVETLATLGEHGGPGSGRRTPPDEQQWRAVERVCREAKEVIPDWEKYDSLKEVLDRLDGFLASRSVTIYPLRVALRELSSEIERAIGS